MSLKRVYQSLLTGKMQTDIDTVIIGGTFNPVHIGHMYIAEEVSKIFRPEKILIVPSYISAHKRGEPVVSAEHRLEMLRIACRNTEYKIETCELDRKGVSYTIDTIRYLKEKYSLKKRPGLLMGDDLVDGFEAWKDAEAVAEEAQLIVACRDEKNINFKYQHIRIYNQLVNISSSDIRKRISDNMACRFLMPSGVYEYIIENSLYGD